MNLNELKIKEVLINTEHGFFSVVFEDNKELQCCLMQRKDGKGYKKAIDSDDNGHDWGICGDVNEWYEGTDGEVNSFLMKEARKAGLKVI